MRHLLEEDEDFLTALMTDHLCEDDAIPYFQSYQKELEIQSTLRFTANKNREEGILEGTIKVARNLLKTGMPIIDVVLCTNLTEAEVIALRNNLKLKNFNK